MSELSPALTYSPEGILTITRAGVEVYQVPGVVCGIAVRADSQLELLRDVAVKALLDFPGVSVDSQKGSCQVSIPVAKALEKELADPKGGEIGLFLKFLQILQPTGNTTDRVDRVITAPNLKPAEFKVDVYEHFQRWLNSSLLTKEVALECLQAMAVLFPEKFTKSGVERDFIFSNLKNMVLARAGRLEVVTKKSKVTLEKSSRRYGKATKVTGSGNWTGLGLDVNAYSRCSLGDDGDIRRNDTVEPRGRNLYSMLPNGVENSRQVLGLLLGVGSLAYHAAQYTGTEDILTDIDWDKSKVRRLRRS